ncbi:hypothetical protein [Chlamydia trachomatis]|uniref:hypothetical protein n=1 Tax=Chlamydia trachomatis TaxID=813 RepID=UPI000F4BDC45|nr:hypothetical protein [Chlamydia trachomatis]ROT58374.1 hypothetical protein DU07_0301 [Chlamydia trachomatis]ROT59020.1 hypothetical protein DU06_0302 [Chlamydia trachomatis]
MVIPKVDLGESAVMMGYKLTSQLAMLSILLTFTHTMGHASQMSQTLPTIIEAQAEEALQADRGVAGQALKKLRKKRCASRKSACKASFKKKDFFSCITNGLFSGNHEQRLTAKKENKARGKEPRVVVQTTKKRQITQSEKEFFDWLCNSKRERKLLKKKPVNTSLAKSEELSPKEAAIAAARASLSLEEKRQLIREWLAEEKTARKSGRAACAVSENLKRDGSITSTLRYDAEKALTTRVKRNENSVNARARQRAALQKAKKAKTEKPEADEKAAEAVAAAPTKQAHKEPENYFAATASTNNTNVMSYLNAHQYRCDSSETDWPCSSCVTKRRANFGISVCTMVVTVIAMIVGAVIISNATDSTVAGSSGTGGGGSTQP